MLPPYDPNRSEGKDKKTSAATDAFLTSHKILTEAYTLLIRPTITISGADPSTVPPPFEPGMTLYSKENQKVELVNPLPKEEMKAIANAFLASHAALIKLI